MHRVWVLPATRSSVSESQLRTAKSLQRSSGSGYFRIMNTWEECQFYITILVTKVNIKQEKVAEGSRCNSSSSYQLKLQDGTSLKVCMALFSSTLGLPKRTITHWLHKDTIDHDEQAASPPSKSGSKSGKHSKLETDIKDFLKDWLMGLPIDHISNINRQLQLLK